MHRRVLYEHIWYSVFTYTSLIAISDSVCTSVSANDSDPDKQHDGSSDSDPDSAESGESDDNDKQPHVNMSAANAHKSLPTNSILPQPGTTTGSAAFAGWGAMTTGQRYIPTRNPIDVIDGNHSAKVYQAQCADLLIAQEIGAMAGMPPLDAAGNVHQSMWAPKLFPMHVGQLTDGKQVAKSMWQQIDAQLAENKSLINAVDDMAAVPKWSFQTIKTHEDQYKQHMHRVYDISPSIFVCMRDALFRVTPHMRNLGIPDDFVVGRLKRQQERLHTVLSTQHQAQFVFLKDSELLLRFMFRCSITQPFMNTIAGRLMNKHEVCNRPGSWASTKTRHDLTREIDEALIRLWDDDKMGSVWVASLKQYLDSDQIAWEMLDHTAHQ